MRFLNLDLDFFVNGIAHWQPNSQKRLSPSAFKPWTKNDVRTFLEKQCGLSSANPVPGRFVTHHDGAFDYWYEIIKKLDQETKIELTHIDAHSDLGMGDSSWKYIMENLLHQPLAQRTNPMRGGTSGLDLGNYIAFAVACRWLGSIKFVLHPKWTGDLAWLHFKNFDPRSGYLQLKKYRLGAIHAHCGYTNLDKIKTLQPINVEPEVLYDMVPLAQYKEITGFDHALLCQSPNYTPRKADELISVFSEFIDFR